MSLKLNVSNSLESLVSAMTDDMKDYESNVFMPTRIITQTQGMNNWLLMKIASKYGIATHIKFYKPSDIIKSLYKLVCEDSNTDFSTHHWNWLIYKVLGSPEFIKQYANIANYYYTDKLFDNNKRNELAVKLTDLYDQYQIYRFKTIQQWNTQPLETVEPRFRWQAYIWKELKLLLEDQTLDMTNMQSGILQALNTPDKVQIIKAQIPNIYLFGLSIITPFHIQILYELAKCIDIHFYLLNPAPEQYWIEDRSEKDILRYKMRYPNIDNLQFTQGNSLLTNWGRVVQDTFAILYRDDLFINEQKEIALEEPLCNTLLGKIQNDIFNNNIERNIINNSDLTDESIMITAHYSPQREVETLYNYLVDTITNKPELEINERDILVVTSDINKYAPYIRGIFDNAPYHFNYSIADESIIKPDSIFSALKSLLLLNEQNFTAENILQILESSFIREKFGITNIDLVRRAIITAGIKFGFSNAKEDDTFIVSWQYGLKRWMYGLCIQGSPIIQEGNELSFIPLDIVDSMADAQQLVLMNELVETLMKFIKLRKTDRNIERWNVYLLELIEKLIVSKNNEHDDDYRRIIKSITLDQKSKEVLQGDTLSYEVWSKHFVNSLSEEIYSGNYLSKGITFCSPLPFRSIPFKIVAILGLNYDSFPRKETMFDIDMIRCKPEIGDRNIKNNDKYLFLELLMSASQSLYLSYIGQSVKDNSSLPPSILIDELLDYIDKGLQEDIEASSIIQKHPLQSFSFRYNNSNYQLIPNFLLSTQDKFPIDLIPQTEAKQEFTEIDFADVISFFEDPIKYYVDKVLGVKLKNDTIKIENTEKFDLNSLEKWKIIQQLLLDKLQSAHNQETIIDTQFLQGQLPLKNVKDVTILPLQEMVDLLSYQLLEIAEYTKSPELISKKVKINISPNILLKGTIQYCNDNSLFSFLTSKSEYKYLSKAYIDFLISRASDTIKNAYFITQDGYYKSVEVSKDEAVEKLKELINIYLKGQDELFFFTKAIVNKKKPSTTENELLKAINAQLNREEYDNTYLEFVYNNCSHNNMFSSHKTIIDTIYIPAYNIFNFPTK